MLIVVVCYFDTESASSRLCMFFEAIWAVSFFLSGRLQVCVLLHEHVL